MAKARLDSITNEGEPKPKRTRKAKPKAPEVDPLAHLKIRGPHAAHRTPEEVEHRKQAAELKRTRRRNRRLLLMINAVSRTARAFRNRRVKEAK